MPVLPRSNVDRIEFCESHLAIFSANSTAIGTTAGAVSDLQTKTEAARAALTAQQEADNARKNATIAFNLAMTAMVDAVSNIIKQVKTKAAISGDSVYALASIPVPATPSPVGSPGTPYGFEVTLNPNGSLDLSWECNNPTNCIGVIYQVYRKVELTAAYDYLGGTGDKKFVDLTVPAGVPALLYQVQGTRSTSIGTAADFVVNFGVTGTGTPEASIAKAAASPKIAA